LSLGRGYAQRKKTRPIEKKAGRTAARRKDSPSGTEDIGLPAEWHPDEARIPDPDEIQPDPGEVMQRMFG